MSAPVAMRSLTLALLLLIALPAAARGEPRLEPGFPVDALRYSGTYSLIGAAAITVGNIDRDPEPEILASGAAAGPLYAWNGDGTRVSGWPRREADGFLYPALGQLSRHTAAYEVVGESTRGVGGAWAGDGSRLGGWPRRLSQSFPAGAMLADLDGDGVDEVLSHTGTSVLHVREATGRTRWVGSISRADGTPPIAADLDGDGEIEIVSVTGPYVNAHDATGRELFTRLLEDFPGVTAQAATNGVAGDVDGDGRDEIILVFRTDTGRQSLVVALGADGGVEWTAPSIKTPYLGVAPALADLDSDGVPEIVIDGEHDVTALRGDGKVFPGFPAAREPDQGTTSTGAVVGDVTGDARPEIVTTTTNHEEGGGRIYVHGVDGRQVPGSPIVLPFHRGLLLRPAIADVDGDGRNEILVAGSSAGFVSEAPYLYAYDFGGDGLHAAPEWGQYAGGPQRQSRYGARTTPVAPPAPSGTSSGARRITGPADPDHAAVLGDRLLFAATTEGAGRELWSSDGVTGALVRDIRPGGAGSDPRALVAVGDQVFFVADDGETGAELWRTDGTEAGTRRVADVWPGAKGSRPVELTAIGDELWFSAWDGVGGYEPWHSDGTEAGTVMLDDWIIGSGADNGAGEGSAPLDFTAQGSSVWFRATATLGSQRLMRTDGTPDGTQTFVVTGPTLHPWSPGDIAAVGGHLFLHNGFGFSHADVADAATAYVPTWPNRFVDDMVVLGDGVVFAATDSLLADDRGLWRARPGSEESRLGDLWPGGDENPSGLLPVGDRVVFAADSDAGREPWVTDGTVDGTFSLGDLRPGVASSEPVILAALGSDRVLFSADDGVHGHELWVSGMTRGTARRLTDLAPGPRSASVRWVERVGERLLLSADDGVHGQALFAIDLPLPEIEPEPTPTATPSATAEPSPTVTPDATATPSPSATATATATPTPGATVTATATPTPTPGATATATPVAIPAPTPSPAAEARRAPPVVPASPRPRLTTVKLADGSVRRGRPLVLTLAASAPTRVRLAIDGRVARTVALTRRSTVRMSTRNLARGRHRLRVSGQDVATRTLRFRVTR